MRSLGVLLLLLSGCPELEDLGDDGGPSSGTEATVAQAEMAAAAVASAAMQIFGDSTSSAKAGQIAALVPNGANVTATRTRSCEPRAVPTVSPSSPYHHVLDDSDAPGIVGTAFLEME